MKRLYNIPYFIAGVLIMLFYFKLCNKPLPPPQPDKLKKTIDTTKAKRAALDSVIIIKESIRTVHVHHWHTTRHDSLIPCETKLSIADTVIMADSSLIFSLKQELFLDSIILGNYSKLASRDSSTIAKLDKKLKRAKKINRILSIVTIGAIGVAVVR